MLVAVWGIDPAVQDVPVRPGRPQFITTLAIEALPNDNLIRFDDGRFGQQSHKESVVKTVGEIRHDRSLYQRRIRNVFLTTLHRSTAYSTSGHVVAQSD